MFLSVFSLGGYGSFVEKYASFFIHLYNYRSVFCHFNRYFFNCWENGLPLFVEPQHLGYKMFLPYL